MIKTIKIFLVKMNN